MKRIFLDTNILIDYIDNREGADDAEMIFACGFSGEMLLFASSLTFANMAYIIKGRTQEEKYDALRQMANVVEILPLGKQDVMSAIAQPVPDFEDMLQYQCAKAANCDYIITNDRRHYDFSDIPHLSSASFVKQLDKLIELVFYNLSFPLFPPSFFARYLTFSRIRLVK